jgi:cysteine synthase A
MPGESGSGPGQRIDIWRACNRISRATEAIRALLVGTDPDNVWPIHMMSLKSNYCRGKIKHKIPVRQSPSFGPTNPISTITGVATQDYDAASLSEKECLCFRYLDQTAELMVTCNGFIDTIGNTPLIRLEAASKATGCEILGKAEFMNPGGSVKDRAAAWMIREAEKNGSLRPGGTIVEGTAGNTGIGIAHIANARGYSCVIYMPDNQSSEKVEILETLGATVNVVPTVPYTNTMNYQKQADRYAQTQETALWVNQFDNTANRLAHYESTGPEIWQQTEGRVDAFACAVGTGGTIAGVSKFLKQQNQDIQIALLDCMGSALYNFVTMGEATMSEGPTITEGIGNSRVTENLLGTEIDRALQVSDQDMVTMVHQLLHEEGWFFGSSTGINICGAIEIARELGPGHTVVTILCDGGGKYRSRLFNQEWLAEKGLYVSQV